MNNTTIQIKTTERLNKLSSSDYDSIEAWQIVEAFNKAQIEWVRRQLRGANQYLDGDEQSKRRVDDLQILLTDVNLPMVVKELFVESTNKLPDNYLEYKRVNCKAKNECCDVAKQMIVYLAEEDNRGLLLRDENKKPSLSWGETFSTLFGGYVRIYTNDEFEVVEPYLTYYRFPVRIEILGANDPYKLVPTNTNVECEFKDDIVELIIDEAVNILAGDTESPGQQQRGSSSAERNN